MVKGGGVADGEGQLFVGDFGSQVGQGRLDVRRSGEFALYEIKLLDGRGAAPGTDQQGRGAKRNTSAGAKPPDVTHFHRDLLRIRNP